MRIESALTPAAMRPLPLDDRARLAERSPAVDPVPALANLAGLAHGRVTSDGPASSPERAAPQTAASPEVARAMAASELAEQPRFAALIGLMERLTGRDVVLVPPATIVLGARQAPVRSAPRTDQVEVSSVSARPRGDAIRLGVELRSPDGARAESVTADVSVDLIRPRRGDRMELRVDASAADVPSGTPLAITADSDGGATVRPAPEHLVDLTA